MHTVLAGRGRDKKRGAAIFAPNSCVVMEAGGSKKRHARGLVYCCDLLFTARKSSEILESIVAASRGT